MTKVDKYGNDRRPAETEMVGTAFRGTPATLAWCVFATGILLLERECSQQKASDPAVMVVSGVTVRQRETGIIVCFLLLRQVPKTARTRCPVLSICKPLPLSFPLLFF